MIFEWSEKRPIENLPELLENYHREGGKIIEYGKVMSFIFISITEPSFDWVPKNKNRTIAGLKYSLCTFLLGWWSLTGFLNTIYTLTVNLSGGIDLTSVLTASSPEEMQRLHLLHTKKMRRKRWVVIFSISALVLIIAALMVVFSSL